MSGTGLFRRLFRRQPPPAGPRPRLVLNEAPAVIYAIGDVHGCLEELQALESRIIRDAEAIAVSKLIVMLGDYVDRGPASAAVLDHLTAPWPDGFERICLAGNHDQMMLDFIAEPAGSPGWLDYGGRETLSSYGIGDAELHHANLGSRRFGYLLAAHIPEDHLQFLARLPAAVSIVDMLFVHGAIAGDERIDYLEDEALLWERSKPARSRQGGPALIVHGHVPRPQVEMIEQHVFVDTGAYQTGVLSALKITPGRPLSVLTTVADTAVEIGFITGRN
ncbi:MAG: metallophosphoesterase [Cucumibacter sp.]